MEKNLIVSRSKRKRRWTSDVGIQFFDMIPIDFVINEIFSRLSVKSMGKCRCVLKLWSSILWLFPTKSPGPPRLLFTLAFKKKLFFFNSPQPQNPDDNSSLVATHHHTGSGSTKISRPVHGLTCNHRSMGDGWTEFVISNPITGQYVALPKIMDLVRAWSYLCYDPIEDQFKVLCISLGLHGTKDKLSLEHQVVTLDKERRNLLWRKIECCKPLYPLSHDGICINGVLYFKAGRKEPMIVCFDVRSERLDFLPGKRVSTLVNYKGKLGAVDNRDEKDFVLWVLENSEEHIWSKHVYEKPLQWRGELYSDRVYAAGVTTTGEIVLSPRGGKRNFWILYYNLERNIVERVRVHVPALKSLKGLQLYTFPNYVKSLKGLQLYTSPNYVENVKLI